MRREIFFALTLVAAACGDDSSDSSDKNEETKQDAGDEPTNDAGQVSAELAAAQQTDGVVATQARADLLIAAFCAKAPTCGSMTSEAACKTASNQGWMNLVDNQADDVCKDAELDRFACLSKASCSTLSTACKSFVDAVPEACPDLGDAGMP